jgi:type II secretory pathway pseudopilin PulG
MSGRILSRYRVRARLADTRREPEAGTTLMEMVIGMTIMAIFMSMFTTAVVIMTQTANKVDSVTVSATQANLAFLKLDKLIRYASAISTPGTGSSGDTYVEVLLTNTGAAQCTQLRVDPPSQQLQQRGWGVDSNGNATAASSWLPLASGVTGGRFVIPAAGASLYQQLQITLSTSSGNTSPSTANRSMTFTAINSNLNQNASVCQQWGRP